MKLLLCQTCGDIVTPGTSRPKWCECRRHAVWWENAITGQLRVHDRFRRPDFVAPACFVIGLANNWLMDTNEYLTRDNYQKLIDEIPDSYIFKTVRSVAIRFRVGTSSDTAYADKLPDVA